MCFRYIPRQALDALGFAKPSITIIDVFDDDGESFRFIENAIDPDNPDEDIDPAFAVSQITLMEGLRDLFRKEIEAKSTFVEEWLHFCTGEAYIPDLVVNPNFKVFIEFSNFKEYKNKGALPSSHTCDKTLKLPASAYGGSVHVFKEKMKQAMDVTGAGFNMP